MKYSNKQKRELVKNDYDAIAEQYNNSYGNIQPYKKIIDRFVTSLNGKNILDVGCGAGQLTNYLCNNGLIAKGLDFSKNLLNIAIKNYPNIDFINSDICEYETEEKFDGIISKDVLFHLSNEDLIYVLSKLKKMLKPSGKICIIMDMPKEDGEHIFIEELDERYKIYYNYMFPEKVKSLLINAGFKIETMDIYKENDNASSYASGLMVFQASN